MLNGCYKFSDFKIQLRFCPFLIPALSRSMSIWHNIYFEKHFCWGYYVWDYMAQLHIIILNILCWQIIPPTVYKICVYYLYDVIMSNYSIPTLLMMMIFGAAQSFRPKSICKSIFPNISSKIPIFLHYLAVTQA